MINSKDRIMASTINKIDLYYLYEIIKSIPNDMELGCKIRLYVNECEKTR